MTYNVFGWTLNPTLLLHELPWVKEIRYPRKAGNLDAPLTMPNKHFTDLLMPFWGKSVELPQKRSYSNW